MPIKAFGIFEGGGARGLAHIGALKAAEERSIEFIGVAGTSAGSIVAALISVGYTADELYDPDSKEGIFDKDFLDFFGKKEGWDKFLHLKNQVEKTFDSIDIWKLIPKSMLFYLTNANFLGSLYRRKGFYSSDLFSEWLDHQLACGIAKSKGIDISDVRTPVQFSDTLIPLKVIATDLTNRKIKIFQQHIEEEEKETAIKDAVSASISIPLFFEPKELNGQLLVDGGLLSNFPAWVFDDERDRAPFNTPTLGFKLVEEKSTPITTSLYSFLRSLLVTALSGDELLETRRVENLRIIRLQTVNSTFDFKLSPQDKDNLYRCGTEGTRAYFRRDTGNPFNSESIVPLLGILHKSIVSSLGKTSNTHLRVNVMLPDFKEGHLKVFYAYNMENDSDDQLSIPHNSTGAGECWLSRNLVVADLQVIRKYSDKYLQALLRQSLKTLMSLPIPDVRHPNGSGGYSRWLGVLNVDSDEDLLIDFQRTEIQQVALDTAVIIARLLTGMV
jgi:NTE family protein